MNNTSLVRSVSSTASALTVEWADGRTNEFLSIWLSDNRPDHRDAFSGQRLVDILDLPLDPRIHSVTLESDSVRIQWEGQAGATAFELSWLAQHAPGEARNRAPELATRLWLEGGTLDASKDFAWSAASEIPGDTVARLAWLTDLLRSGIAFLRGLPRDEAALLKTVSSIGQVLHRVPNYRGLVPFPGLPQAIQ